MEEVVSIWTAKVMVSYMIALAYPKSRNRYGFRSTNVI